MISFIAVVTVFYDFLIYVMHVGVRDGCLFFGTFLFFVFVLFLGVYVFISWTEC